MLVISSLSGKEFRVANEALRAWSHLEVGTITL